MPLTADDRKNALRKERKQCRRQYTAAQRCLWDSAIAHALLGRPEYQQAPLLLTFLSAPQEVSTALPVAHALGMGKLVAVPRWGAGQMEFCLFTDYRNLTRDPMGLLQPLADAPVVTDTSGAICLVPALAVDEKGYRLGYGGGYYDRFLAEFGGFSVTLAYDDMLTEQLPVGEYDLPVDCIVTPTRVLYLN
ncbi:MAG: 5-formyltetrahydrofolate cyclo-ligase [Angelakisella sp.]